MSPNSPLIETIRILNGRVYNIRYHNARCNRSRQALFKATDKLNLRRYIDSSQAPSALTKCRVTYDQEVISVEYEPYELRPIESLRLVEIDGFSYDFKFKDREQLAIYYSRREGRDDVLLVKNNFVTDSYYANVAFLRNGKWYTPKSPLLHGTMRSMLCSKNRLILRDILASEIFEYEKICLFNAMIPFGKLVFSTEYIFM